MCDATTPASRYQAGSWTKPRRVVAKVEWHPGELYPRVGFIVTNMARPAENVVAFYNKRGTCEQWIKEGKGAIKWTRLSCRSFAANAVRLQLHALAYNLGNFLRTLATPEPIKDWSLTSLKEKLIKIGAKVVSHGRYVAFQMAEVAIPRNLFADILRLIAELRPRRSRQQRRAFGCHAFVKTDRRRVSWSRKIWPSERSTRLRCARRFRRRAGGRQTASSRLSGAQNRRRFGLTGAIWWMPVNTSRTNPCAIANGRLGPGRRPRSCRNGTLQEPLRHQNEHIEIKRGDRAADVNQPPNSGEVEGVVGDDRGQEQNERQDADRARRIKAKWRQRKPLRLVRIVVMRKSAVQAAEDLPEQQTVQDDEPRQDADQAEDDMDLKHRDPLR